ncbi:MAG TPA: GAF domain-containing protein [Anaerolineae bacterium]|nr:GAF domain-containing protein [Anaerolineae bacterium]
MMLDRGRRISATAGDRDSDAARRSGQRLPPWTSLPALVAQARVFGTATRRYAAVGVAFGFMFPVVATGIAIGLNNWPLSLESALAVQRAQPLLWIIDTAPFFLGLFAAVAGRHADSLYAANRRLNEMTKELENAKAEAERKVAERTEQVRAGSVVARVAASILDPDRLLRDVVNLIADHFRFDYAAVFTLDAEGRYAMLREATGDVGQILKQRGYRLEIGGQSMIGTAIAWRKPRLVLDVSREPILRSPPPRGAGTTDLANAAGTTDLANAADRGEGAAEGRFANLLLPNARSELALPLMVGERVLGALDVQSAHEAAFDEASTTVLQSVADQIAIALNNAEQFHRAERQAAALAVLNQLSRDLTMAASLEAIGHAAVTALASLVAVDGLLLGLATPNLETVRIVPLDLQSREQQDSPRSEAEALNAVKGQWESIPPALSAAQTFVGQCIRTGQNVLVADLGALASAPYQDAALARKAGMRSLIGVPLQVGGQTVGALFAGAARLDAYAPDDVSRVEQVAAQLAVAVESLNRAEDMRQALEGLDAANRRLTGQAWSAFARRLSRQGVIRIGSHVDDKAPSPEVEEVISTGQLVVHPAKSSTEGAGEGYRVAVPIVLRGVPIGAFRLSVPEHSWSDDLAATLDSIAGHVAQAVENARLVEEAEERAARERALADATERVRSKADVERILQTAAEELARHLNAAGVAVRFAPGVHGSPDAGQERSIAGNGAEREEA